MGLSSEHGFTHHMTAARGKILVIRGGAIGDFILTLPAISALRNRFPDIPLEVLGYPRIAALARASGLVDSVQPIDARPMAGFFARNGDLNDALSDYFGGFAVILSYLFDPDHIFQINVARASAAQFIVGPHRPDERENIHATNVYLKPLEKLAIFEAEPRPRIRVQTGSNGNLPAGHWIALHPGSGSERKNWPESGWARFIRRLIDTTDRNILIVGGEAEGDRLMRLAGRLPSGRCQIAQNLPLPELALKLQQCVRFIGHDSGISHLAAAVGLPGLILWGHTNRAVWQPLGAGIDILQPREGLQSLSADVVYERFVGGSDSRSIRE